MDRSFISASMSEVTIQNCITCYLCGDIFRRPRVLPCGHTFCSECLAKQRDEIIGQGITYHKGLEARPEISADSKDSYGTDSIKSFDHNTPHKHLNNNHVDASKEDDDSSNVDYIHPDADPNCYRPQLSHKSHAPKLRSDTYDADQSKQPTANGMTRSCTFTREQSPVSTERSPSRFSAPPGSISVGKACSKCGHVASPTIAHRAKTSQQKSSSRDRSTKLRDGATSGPRWDSSPQRTKSASHLAAPACSFEQKHGREMEPFFCPLPECNYSLRIMNLSRWSPRNKTVADIVGVWRHLQENMQDATTQTEISTNQSVLVTIPRSLVNNRSVQPLGQRRRHSSMVDMAIDSAISMDSLDRGYIPRGHLTWRSYAAMVGMNILHQLVNL